MKRLLGPPVAALILAALGRPHTAHAGPPIPPPTPSCRWCGGPPPAPTPVPTLAPTMVAPDTRPVAVQIAPTKVHRGGQTRVSITASPNDKVTMVVRYFHARPVTYHAGIGPSGRLIKQWKVARSAPLGKATVRIAISGDQQPYSGVLTFTVVK